MIPQLAAETAAPVFLEDVMFDNVTIKVYNLPQSYVLCKRVKNIHQEGIGTNRGRLKNLGLFQNHNGLIIKGSLAKYLRGENITPLKREEIMTAIKKLEEDVNLCLKNAVVSSVEFGTSIITKEKPFEYLHLFGHTKRLTRVEYSKWTGVETVTYIAPKGSFEFIGYDKIKEMHYKKKDVPSLYDGTNVLRLEYKIKRKKGIEAKFKEGLSVYNLFDESIYQRFQKLFYDSYKSIDKMGQLVYADKSKNMTPSRLKRLQAEQYRQSFPKDYRYFIQQLKEAGKISPKNLERIRAENRELGHDIDIAEQSTLIKELDALVYDRVYFGT